MNPLNFGSGSQLLGGNVGSAMGDAMSQQAMGQAGATSMVSPAAPSFQPMPQPTQGQAPAAPQPVQSPEMGADWEASLILKTLAERLKSHSKQAELAAAPPPQPQAPMYPGGF